MYNLQKNKVRKRKYIDFCSYCLRFSNRERPITAAAVIGIGRCCLIKYHKNQGCPNHGQGELVIKKRWIGVKNCSGCVKEDYPPDENGINQIVWDLDMEEELNNLQKENHVSNQS